ncbi:hypothetical protein ElyMa_004838900 [Elysia marginata]|uniref:Uncharacterized protein n=1 Tax=Elysia marginata TaxID=1093978 RepID=A0AAV4INV9_9GAST|nr:hypothetical protein ElyMa_004838900 [Elysia marginata]
MGWTQYRIVLHLRILLLSHSNNNNFVLLLHAIFYKFCLCSVFLTVRCRSRCGCANRQKIVGSGLTVGPYAGGDLPKSLEIYPKHTGGRVARRARFCEPASKLHSGWGNCMKKRKFRRPGCGLGQAMKISSRARCFYVAAGESRRSKKIMT